MYFKFVRMKKNESSYHDCWRYQYDQPKKQLKMKKENLKKELILINRKMLKLMKTKEYN